MDSKEEFLLKKNNKWSAVSAIATVSVAITTMVIGYFSYRVSERSVQIAEDAKNLVELNNIQDLFTRVQDEALTERNVYANAIIDSFYDKFIIFAFVRKYDVEIYGKLEEMPHLLEGDFFHSLELFQILEKTPGITPFMAVATQEKIGRAHV